MLGVLREREFRLLWLGQSASTVGDRLLFVALALYVTEIGTPTDVGIVIAVLIFTGGVEIWMIVVIEVVFGAAEAFFRPAMTWLVPQTVSESQVQEANSRSPWSTRSRSSRGRPWPRRWCWASARAGTSSAPGPGWRLRAVL